MTRRRWTAGATACLAAVSLAGCSGGAPVYEDLPGLAAAVAGEGVPCDGVDRKPGTDLVEEIGSCRGADVTLYVFDGEEALDDWKRVASLVTPAAVGPNWAVTGERPVVDRIAKGLGAETTPASND